MVLTAGRPTLDSGEATHRGEGVGIVLLRPPGKQAGSNGRHGAHNWSLEVQFRKGRRPTHLHILSCYAPTFAANREAKDKFYDDLQSALDLIPYKEPYLILGDFNARV